VNGVLDSTLMGYTRQIVYGNPSAFNTFQVIAVDSAGHIYVSDSVNNNILIFESDGRYLKTWGKTGSLSGDFWTPQGLFIDERDHIYIADQTNARIQVYQFQK